MKVLFSFFLILFCCNSVVYSQSKTYSLSLFYPVNQFAAEANATKLDSLLKELGASSCTISIKGYADFLFNDSFNSVLSQKRAETVKKHLLSNKGSTSIVISTCQGFGEKNSNDNSSPEGQPYERRVDLMVVQQIPVKKISPVANKVQEEKVTIDVSKKIEKKPEDKNIVDLEKGESMDIEGLSFIPGRHMVLKSAYPVLRDLLIALRDHPNLKIEIQGHVCCPEAGLFDGLDHDTHTYNLSENRAKAVYTYLVKYGIDEDRLSYKGYGNSQLKIKIEKTPEDEQVNRRVEIKILEN